MKILGIETASPTGGVALIDGEVLLGAFMVRGSASHSRHCLKAADEILKATETSWGEVEMLAVSHGPGSFTGIRVGLSLVKGLAVSLGKPVMSVSSLEVLAFGAREAEGNQRPIVGVLDARQDEIYAGVFGFVSEGKWGSLGEEVCLSLTEFGGWLPQGALVVGEGLNLLGLKNLTSSKVSVVDGRRNFSSAISLGFLAREKFLSGEMAVGAENVNARYIRQVAFREQI